ncbi:unnamed protein product [Paramecium sonneborni]|uniref:Uncharacterized protein n=1 Tax=Paramecium sonneborni TaxID=65129 RepID=A0A8S1QAZ9_9CILI|nr:unnamed protein product [Paramecium sonneborni]
MDEKLYDSFQKILIENQNLKIQNIIQGQVRVIQQNTQSQVFKNNII